MAAPYSDVTLIPNPKTLTEVVLNLRDLIESEIIFSPELFEREFCLTYFGGSLFVRTPQRDGEAVTISHFDALAEAVPSDGPALKGASLTIQRELKKNGATSIVARMNLSESLLPNSVDYKTLQNIFRHKLITRDPLDFFRYFPLPTDDPYANHFYYSILNGRTGERAVVATVGHFSTLDDLSLGADRAKR